MLIGKPFRNVCPGVRLLAAARTPLRRSTLRSDREAKRRTLSVTPARLASASERNGAYDVPFAAALRVCGTSTMRPVEAVRQAPADVAILDVELVGPIEEGGAWTAEAQNCFDAS